MMYNYLLARQRGLWDWHNVHLIHSKTVEDLAFRHVVRLGQRTGVGMYFVHVTAKDGLDVIAEARAAGMPVYGEVLTPGPVLRGRTVQGNRRDEISHLPVAEV